jgi:hypothetical protein
LLSDIENSIDTDKVLEERTLDSEVKFSLREVLGIASSLKKPNNCSKEQFMKIRKRIKSFP